MIDAILDEADRLADFPELGTPLSAITSLRNDEGYRYLTSGSCMIFYRAAGRDLYGGRDYLRALGLEPSPET